MGAEQTPGTIATNRKKRRMGEPRAVLMLCLALVITCACQRKLEHQSVSAVATAEECTLQGFTKSLGFELIEIEKPFIVQQVKGCILNANEPEGDWPKWASVLLELKRSGSDKATFLAHADEMGRFSINGVPEGRYCFLATQYGWNSVRGVIIVSRGADKASVVSFKIDIAL